MNAGVAGGLAGWRSRRCWRRGARPGRQTRAGRSRSDGAHQPAGYLGHRPRQQRGWVAGRRRDLPGCTGAGLGPTEHATLKADIIEGGILGIDGTPVAPGTYVAPSQELGDRTFDVVQGQTFYVILATQVVNSNIPFIPVGRRSRTMLTFENLPGRNSQLVVAWRDTPTGWVPFLNEGVMMTNIRQQR